MNTSTSDGTSSTGPGLVRHDIGRVWSGWEMVDVAGCYHLCQFFKDSVRLCGGRDWRSGECVSGIQMLARDMYNLVLELIQPQAKPEDSGGGGSRVTLFPGEALGACGQSRSQSTYPRCNQRTSRKPM